MRRIHATYAQPLNLTQLASEAGMSVPTFHSHFKAITHLSPIQYVKSVRLHQARMLMVRQDMTAAAASHGVGYESPSQFNREFKRLFGLPPAEEIRRMQKASHYRPPKRRRTTAKPSHRDRLTPVINAMRGEQKIMCINLSCNQSLSGAFHQIQKTHG
ncbi:HTH-type transcriptional activator RhaS [Sodalis praecaptivus]